jgi:hypothetical protein
MANCMVLRCPEAGSEVFELETPGARQHVHVCPDHETAIRGGSEEWVYMADFRITNPDREPNQIVMRKEDLLSMNEWVVESYDAMRQGLDRASSTGNDEWIFEVTARRRGTDLPEKLRLAISPEMRSKIWPAPPPGWKPPGS